MTTTTNALPQLMAGFATRQMMNQPAEAVAAARYDYPVKVCMWVVEDMAKRQAESRKMFRWKFFRGDCHAHSQHSDGRGTVAEIAAMVQAAGLDFQFVTDHWGVTQAPECRGHGLWVGQEPGTQHHHLGILGLEHAFTPQQDFLADVAEAKRQGAVIFIPHPTGWWPFTVYKQEQLDVLEKLPDPFLMEICNGASNLGSAFDYTDESAVALWDKLLTMGKTVHAMGNTDAHLPHAIGMVWNSVFAPRCEQRSILQALSGGRSFVSDGPLLHIAVGKSGMGRRAGRAGRGQKLSMTAADSRGLSWVRAVGDGGKELGRWWCRGSESWSKQVTLPARIKRYVRVEVRSEDGRRAYSNPVYLG